MHQLNQAVVGVTRNGRLSTPNLNLIESAEAKIETAQAVLKQDHRPGLADPDRQVLKIDYDLLGNPRLSIRRILDELVQVENDFYLGKAHLKWWWGTWQLVAYFSLHASK
ncbi:MAG: hypothetical protein HS126_08000 [Anaerolineales bacterium]|nr:hypothetical protein [Anaerolineales bacterium]